MRSPTHPSRNRRPPQSRGAKILPSPARIAGIAARAAAERESEGLARASLRASIPVPQAPLAPSRSKLHVRPSQPSSRSLTQLQDGEGRPSRPQHVGASKRGPSVAIIGAASLANGPTSLAGGSSAAAATAAAPPRPRRPIAAGARTAAPTPPASPNTRAVSRGKGGASSTASAVATVSATDVAVAATAADGPDVAASAHTGADADASTDAGGAAGAASAASAAGVVRLSEPSRPPLQLPPTPAPAPAPTPRQQLLLDALAQVGGPMPSLAPALALNP